MFVAMFCSVALPLPRLAPLTYLLPEPLGVVTVGCRVLVPLGKRIVTGTVTAVDVDAVDNARPVIEVVDDAPSFTPSVLRLATWVADYYLCSVGEVLQAAMPSGLAPEAVVRVSLVDDPSDATLEAMERRAPKRAALVRLLREHRGDISVAWIEQRLGTTSIADQLDALQRAGVVRITNAIDDVVGPRMARAVALADHLAGDDAALRAAFDELDRRAPKQSVLLGQLYLARQRGEGPSVRATLLQETHSSASALDALVAKGLAVDTTVIVRRTATEPGDLARADEVEAHLTDEQQAAVDVVHEAVRSKAPQPILLDGVTGSGKTLVYLHAIRHVLAAGATALVLVPEISLTPQLSDRFRAAFGDLVVMLHSRMGTGERADAWRAIRDGSARVVIGPRSAVFAPLENVGLIVVDEEHEPSYKQDDPAPRYHGRDVAIVRATIEGCPVVLGSATPSLESVANVRSGRFRHCRLTHRADGATLPATIVVDMRAERKAGRIHAAFSHTMLDAVADRLDRGEGVLVFLNRRGFAASLHCADCGDVPSCRNCDVALTWHKHAGALRCHYCGYVEPARTICTTCGGTSMTDVGTGTQRIEEDLVEWIVQTGRTARVQRMDADTTSKKGSHRRMLQQFADGAIDVLVGTQMIAKGLDIARVTLACIVNADQALHQADFRASERTVQLIVQVAGRAGRRGDRPGAVIVQTSSPTHPAIVAATTGAMESWQREEFLHRAEALYPPVARFIVIDVSGMDEELVNHHATIVERLIPAEAPSFIRLPAIPPAIPRVRNRYRRVIVVKNVKKVDPSGGLCRRHLAAALEIYYRDHAHRSVRVSVDVDANGTP